MLSFPAGKASNVTHKMEKNDVLQPVTVDSKPNLTPVYSNASVKKCRLTPSFKRDPQFQTSSAQRVEQLLNSIEQQLNVHETIPTALYPTDALLTQTDTDPPQ